MNAALGFAWRSTAIVQLEGPGVRLASRSLNSREPFFAAEFGELKVKSVCCVPAERTRSERGLRCR